MNTTTDIAFRDTLIILGAIVLVVVIGFVFNSFLPLLAAVVGCGIWLGKIIFGNYLLDRKLRRKKTDVFFLGGSDKGGPSLSLIKMGKDGFTHEFLAGTTCYGKGHVPDGSHKPQTIIELDK